MLCCTEGVRDQRRSDPSGGFREAFTRVSVTESKEKIQVTTFFRTTTKKWIRSKSDLHGVVPHKSLHREEEVSDDSETVRNNSRKRALKIIKIEEREEEEEIFGKLKTGGAS